MNAVILHSESRYKIILPLELRKYFWDVQFEELSWEKHSRFIAERILNYGNQHDIKWLIMYADTSFIRTLVNSSRNINAKTRNYWQLMLD